MSTLAAFIRSNVAGAGRCARSGSGGLSRPAAVDGMRASARVIAETVSAVVGLGMSGQREATRMQYEVPGGHGCCVVRLPSAVSIPRHVVNRLRPDQLFFLALCAVFICVLF
jgi:hypothetical protein